MKEQKEILELYNTSLEEFIERVKQDTNIIAGILFGSLVSGRVWEESDIDLLLISKDESRPSALHWLADGDILIQVGIQSRSNFRQSVERSLDSSLVFHILSTGKLLFSKDESLTKYIEDAHEIGERDRQMQLFRLAMHIPGNLSKVRKSLHVHNDHIVAFRFLMYAMEMIARIDLVRSGIIPGREFLQQAIDNNPMLFNTLYTDMVSEGATRDAVENALQLLTNYLEEQTPEIYQPLLDFIVSDGGHCGATLIDTHFKKKLGLQSGATLIDVCEWLANQGVIQRMPRPLRLTSRSRQEEMEAAYYFSEDDLL